MNNMGVTPLHLIASKKLYNIKNIASILKNGDNYMNLFITTNEKLNVLDMIGEADKNQFLDIAVLSYYNHLIKNKNMLVVDWEKYCAEDDMKNIISFYKKNKLPVGNKKELSTSYYCKKYIREMITIHKRSFPQFIENNYTIEYNMIRDNCYYTGSTLDILFGMLYLYSSFSNINLILEYPLTQNLELDSYYKKMGINYSLKLDFLNIELIWSYMKLISMTHFDSLFKIMIGKIDKQFIAIPLGIEIASGSHANIIIIDMINQTIERFEPNGKNNPLGFYYNPILLDSILYNKFIHFLPNFTYLKPSDFLPVIGFQIYETMEEDKCKKIGDPNGFCAVWCVWWAEQRVNKPSIKPIILCDELIKTIKLKNKSFRNMIRNYSSNISSMRDTYLAKYNLTIDDWMVNNYTMKDIDRIERDVMEIIQR